MTRLEYLLQQHERIVDWYKQSEAKSSFLVTINTLAVGAVNGLVFVGADKVAGVRSVYGLPVWGLLALSGIGLVGSYLFVLKAVWARHHGPSVPTTDDEKLWFFGDLAAMSRAEHRALVSRWSEERLESDLAAQNHILSTNVKTKYDALNCAISLTIASLILLFMLAVAYAIAVTHAPLPAAPGGSLAD